MNKEQSFFLQVLKNFLNKEKTTLVTEIDWKKLYNIAHAHQVEGIVYYQCKEFLPSDIYSLFHNIFNASLFYYANRKNTLNELQRQFNNSEITSFPVKGLDVAQCYPVPALRTMGDLDIVVHRKDKLRAGEILESKGNCIGEKAPDYNWSYIYNGFHIELHHHLIYDEGVNIRVQTDFFNDCWKYAQNGHLDWGFHFLFLIAHLRKHMINSGAGFRMFMDIAAVIQYDPGINWSWVEEKLKILGLVRFSSACFCLIEHWFDIKAPIQYVQLDSDFIEAATEKIFANGIFGFNNDDNKINESISALLKYGSNKPISRFRMVVRYLFPKYIHMRYIPYYSFIEGRPWLLPVAWGYRFSRFLLRKDSGADSFIENLTLTNDVIDARENELKKWGLIN